MGKMRVWNFEKIFFRLNVAVTIVIFILLAPTTHIFASWYPGKDNILWLFPLLTVIVSAILWLLMSLTVPFLIKAGIFEDRRRSPRPGSSSFPERMTRVMIPVAGFAFQTSLLILFCAVIVAFMQSGVIEGVFVNLP